VNGMLRRYIISGWTSNDLTTTRGVNGYSYMVCLEKYEEH